MARGRHGIVSVESARDLAAVQSALSQAPAELHRLLNATASQQLSGAWYEELDKQSGTPQQEKFVLAGAEAIPLASGLMASTGERREKLGRIFEFGSKNRDKVTSYFRSGTSKRKAHTVKRHTARQVPAYKAGGYIAYPAANKLGTRVFHMWGELIHKVIHEATEEG